MKKKTHGAVGLTNITFIKRQKIDFNISVFNISNNDLLSQNVFFDVNQISNAPYTCRDSDRDI